MSKYDNNLTGVLFANAEKQSDSSPDFKGEGEINGVKFWVNGWKNKSAKGTSYLRLTFKVKESKASEIKAQIDAQPAAARTQPKHVEEDSFFDDSIPF